MATVPAIELKNITKTFGPKVIANKNVCLTANRGEILSILGENGSGKTTLMNMIAGIYYPDEGQILIGGQEVTIASPTDAFDYKIGMIHQHFKLVDVFTAAENVVLGLEEARFDMKAAVEKVREICVGLSAKFTDDANYADDELAKVGKNVLCMELTPDHMTGKLVNES